MKVCAPVVLILVATTLSCGEAQEATNYTGVVKFDSASIRVVTPRGPLRLRVELAISGEQRTMGLMERQALADTAGMLFLYERDQPAEAGFWMFRTRIPLDIAFIDSTGRVVAIRQMVPCPATLASGCPSYDPGVPYRAALEVNAGVFARHGIAAGAQVDLPRSKQP